MAFNRSDLQFDYFWTSKDGRNNPYYVDGRHHSDLNRSEGHEVLYFINHYAKINGWSGTYLKDFHKLEQMLNNCPKNIRTHARVEAWIKENWSEY